TQGHDVVILARSRGVDVVTGAGLQDGLRGVEAVVDTLNTTSLSRRKAIEFFRTTSRRLLEVGARQGVAHHVVLSIVGIDGIDESHYAGKLAQEQIVEASDVPHTIARATQFHEFAEQISDRTSLGPLTIAPRMPTRPVAAREVGEHLIRVAEADPAGRAPDRNSTRLNSSHWPSSTPPPYPALFRSRSRSSRPPTFRTRSPARHSSTSSPSRSVTAPPSARSPSRPACPPGRSPHVKWASTSSGSPRPTRPGAR